MSLAEFMEWLAWDAVSPIGDERCFDLPGAMIRQTARAVAGEKNPPKLEKLLPFRTETPGSLDGWMQGLLTNGRATS